MDLFVGDALDDAPGRATAALSRRDLFDPYPTTLKLDRLMACPELATGLAFREAWRAAFGARPTRLDVADFRAALRASGGDAQQAVAATLLGEGATLRTTTQQHAEQVVSRARAAYRDASASFGAEPALLRRALLDKFADRFSAADGGDAGAGAGSDATSLVVAYARMAISDPLLEPLERWAASFSLSAAAAACSDLPDKYAAPRNVAEYYRRVAAAAERLGLPGRNPLTGFRVSSLSSLPPSSPPLSCVELLRLPINRDGFLWRRDAGGALLQVEPGGFLDGDEGAELLRALRRQGERGPRVATVPAPLIVRATDGASLCLYARVALTGPLAKGLAGGKAVRLSPAVTGSEGSPEVVVSARPPPLPALWLPESGLCFGALVRAPPWACDLRAAMLSAMLAAGSPLRLPMAAASSAEPQAAAGALLFHQLVARQAAARRLGSRVFITAMDEAAAVGEVVLVDDRDNVWSTLAVLCTLDALARPQQWTVRVLCGSDRAREFFERTLKPTVPHARVEMLGAADGLPPRGARFDIEDHNALFKSAAFWRRLRAPLALLVQDDGALFRRPECPCVDDDAELLAQHYVGAPWDAAGRGMLEAAGVGGSLVGNGGLSLRRVATMVEVCERDAELHGRALFNSDTQPVPEDVFFAAALERRGLSCPRPVADRFAFEMQHRGGCYGLHKPWPYVPFSSFLSEVRTIVSWE